MLQVQLAIATPGGFTATGTVHMEVQFLISIVALVLSYLH